ncbi:MAG: hypothetical protein EBS85_01455 [Micrococcales bacterium]|nr:hypothetical protein [Micrococcales bacterium]
MFFVLHRINKAQPLVWRDPQTLQVGLGLNALILPELTLQQQQIVDALYSGVVEGQQQVLDDTILAESGQTQSLIQLLKPLSDKPISNISPFGDWQQLAFSEIARASLDYQVNGEMVLAERWQRNVHIDQIDKTGLLLTKALLASGVGDVLTHDDGVVLASDLGELGYPKQYLGKRRFESLQLELSKLALPNTQKQRLRSLAYKPDKSVKISFALIVGHLALLPTTYSRWLNRDVSHLSITFNLESADVSPVITPGRGACLNCIQEYKVDEDNAWPVIASQLIALPRVRDDASALLTTVGFATRSVLRHLDETAGFRVLDQEIRSGYHVDYATGSVTRTKFHVHKLCSCQEPKLDLDID